MTLRVWYQDDIHGALVGLAAVAVDTYIANGEGSLDHIEGVLTMARGMALSFGLDWPAMLTEIRAEGYGWIIDECTKGLIEG